MKLKTIWNAIYKGYKLDIMYFYEKTKKPGKRRLYLRYSICNEKYFLTDRS